MGGVSRPARRNLWFRESRSFGGCYRGLVDFYPGAATPTTRVYLAKALPPRTLRKELAQVVKGVMLECVPNDAIEIAEHLVTLDFDAAPKPSPVFQRNFQHVYFSIVVPFPNTDAYRDKTLLPGVVGR